jgi:hypothetical protein
VDTLRQAALVQDQGEIVARGRRKIGQTMVQLEHKCGGGQRAQ